MKKLLTVTLLATASLMASAGSEYIGAEAGDEVSNGLYQSVLKEDHIKITSIPKYVYWTIEGQCVDGYFNLGSYGKGLINFSPRKVDNRDSKFGDDTIGIFISREGNPEDAMTNIVLTNNGTLKLGKQVIAQVNMEDFKKNVTDTYCLSEPNRSVYRKNVLLLSDFDSKSSEITVVKSTPECIPNINTGRFDSWKSLIEQGWYDRAYTISRLSFDNKTSYQTMTRTSGVCDLSDLQVSENTVIAYSSTVVGLFIKGVSALMPWNWGHDHDD